MARALAKWNCSGVQNASVIPSRAENASPARTEGSRKKKLVAQNVAWVTTSD